MDRLPARISPNSTFKPISHLCEQLNVIDVWRYLHPYQKEYTWSNVSGSLQSGTDLWLLSSSTLHFVSETLHSCAPFSDHKLIVVTFANPQEQTRKSRGFWTLNCNLLNDEAFWKSVEATACDIFNCNELSNVQKWEFFSFKIREMAIKYSKEMKKRNTIRELETMAELNSLINKGTLTEEEELNMTSLKEEVDQLYINMTKGAFIRSRATWLEEGERNT